MPEEATSEPEGLRRHHDLLIPVGDETMAATRYEPLEESGPLPVVLMAIPYRKDDRITYGRYDPDLQYIARQGYEVVAADLLGTGASSGRKPHPMAGDEGEQVATAIEWLADRPWSTGTVGMYGKSYGAFTQLRAAAERPDSLAAIAPTMVGNSLYETSYPGGTVSGLRRAMWTTQMLASRVLPPSYRDRDGRWAEVWKDRLQEIQEERPWFFKYLDHPTKDEFWREASVRVEEIEVPALVTVGYRDTHTPSVVEYFDRMNSTRRLLLGPWRHTMPHRGRESTVDYRRQAVEWYDQFLKGESTGALDRPTVSFWTERDGGWRIDGGSWRGAASWPTVDAAEDPIALSVTPDGLARAAAFEDGAVEAEYEYDHSVGPNSLDRVGFVANESPDTTPDDVRSLVFDTGPLTDAIEFTGTGEARIRLRAGTPDPLVFVRVNDVAPDGETTLVTHGLLRASHRDGHDESKPLEPGREYDLSIGLKPKSHVFERGHRIRLAVGAAYFPRAFPTRDHGSFAVLSTPDAPSGLSFPGVVHDAGVSFDDAIEMRGPDDLVSPASPLVSNHATAVETGREQFSDSARFATTDSYDIDLPHGPTMRWEHDVEASVRARDPLSANVHNDVRITLDYGYERVEVRTTSRLSHDLATVAATATVDGETVFDETWRR